MTVEDNIKLPFLYASPDKKGVGEIGDFNTIISVIKIRHILKKKPLECSGGERARAVFATLLIMRVLEQFTGECHSVRQIREKLSV